MADLSDHYSYHRTTAADDDLYGWLLELIEGPEWMKRARCKGEDVNMFYPPRGGVSTAEVTAPIKLLCSRCPVRIDCLEYGLGDREGWWGGLSPTQRKHLRIKRKREQGIPYGGPHGVPARCGTDGGYYRHRRAGHDACPECKAAHSAAERSRFVRNTKQVKFADRRDEGACPRCARYEHDKCQPPCQCDKCHPIDDEVA